MRAARPHGHSVACAVERRGLNKYEYAAWSAACTCSCAQCEAAQPTLAEAVCKPAAWFIALSFLREGATRVVVRCHSPRDSYDPLEEEV